MANGSEQIVISSDKVDKISNEMAVQVQTVSAAIQVQTASMEQIALSIQVLATMAQELQNSVLMFKV
jgi:methyl-accepting chemotaxis protein